MIKKVIKKLYIQKLYKLYINNILNNKDIKYMKLKINNY
jgi:hypothetical protein